MWMISVREWRLTKVSCAEIVDWCKPVICYPLTAFVLIVFVSIRLLLIVPWHQSLPQQITTIYQNYRFVIETSNLLANASIKLLANASVAPSTLYFSIFKLTYSSSLANQQKKFTRYTVHGRGAKRTSISTCFWKKCEKVDQFWGPRWHRFEALIRF